MQEDEEEVVERKSKMLSDQRMPLGQVRSKKLSNPNGDGRDKAAYKDRKTGIE